MKYMFEGCSSLSSLPDISKWKIHDDTTIKNMFKGCKNRSFFQNYLVRKVKIEEIINL